VSQVIAPVESRNSDGVQIARDLVVVPQEQAGGVCTPLSPTQQTYEVLDAAFKHFNDTLFGGALPDCLVTLQRQANTQGYFSPDKLVALDGDARLDEIALNPAFFKQSTPRDTCSTLVHEMVHQWQRRFGKKAPRSGYHDREWAGAMRAIGLQPISADGPDKEVGYKVGHFIIDDGPFDRSFKVFEASGQTLRWGDVLTGTNEKKKPKRLTFICPGCDQKVQGIPKTRVRCDVCNVVMVARDKGEADDTNDTTNIIGAANIEDIDTDAETSL
jgi:hypothetical protein